jgi:BirA family biotin operon repressor/biotin-[acetyl-CoA-carboxylase] ligase
VSGDTWREDAAVRTALGARGEDWKAPLEHCALVGSTNEILKERARAGSPVLSAVRADRQTAGRGRQGRPWVSPRGNLHLSVLLRPPSEVAGLVPILGGVATARALVAAGVDPRLKWPNDVLVGERKLAGVLSEAASGAPGIEWVVLGLGVNVDPEEELPDAATSVRQETGRDLPVPELAALILAEIRVWYHALAEGRAGLLRTAWRERSVDWWGCEVAWQQGDSRLTGLARDIDDDGALLLEQPEGGLVRVVAGEVNRVRLRPSSASPGGTA